jgi:ankyrin repeat protein
MSARVKAITIKKLDRGNEILNRTTPEEKELYNAVDIGNIETVQTLLTQGVNVNSKHQFGWTVLHVATNKAHIEILKILLSREGVDFCSKDNSGKNALHLAANKRNVELVKVLVPQIPINSEDYMGETALHIASKNNQEETIQYLLDNGANINALDGGINTALHSAAFNGRITAIKCLLKNPIDINAMNADKQTALDIAANRGYVEFIRILLAHGCNIPNNINICPDLYNTGTRDIEEAKLQISSMIEVGQKVDDVFNNIIQDKINIPEDLTTLFIERFKWHLKGDYWTHINQHEKVLPERIFIEIKHFYDDNMEIIRIFEASIISNIEEEEVSPVPLYLLLTQKNYARLDITNDIIQKTLWYYKKHYPELSELLDKLLTDSLSQEDNKELIKMVENINPGRILEQLDEDKLKEAIGYGDSPLTETLTRLSELALPAILAIKIERVIKGCTNEASNDKEPSNIIAENCMASEDCTVWIAPDDNNVTILGNLQD